MDDVEGRAEYANKVRPTFPNEAATRILEYTFPNQAAYQPHLATPTLPSMGLNRIPAGILIRAGLLRLKANRIPSFIRGQEKRSEGSVETGISVGKLAFGFQ